LVFGRPCPALRSKVLRYCGYVEPAGGGATRVQLSSGVVALVVGFGSPVRVAYPCHPAGGSTARVTSFVAGLHSVYAVVESPGRQHGVQVDLTPLGAHMLLGVPMGALGVRAPLGARQHDRVAAPTVPRSPTHTQEHAACP